MTVDKRPFGERLGSWGLPRMHGISWLFVNLSFWVWVCGWTPSWLRSWLPPMPHTLRNFAAPFLALIAAIVLSSFIRRVLYKGIEPSDPNAYYDQSNVRHFLQIGFSLLAGVSVYPLIWLFSEWFWIFNYLFAFGIGSFIYIVIDSYCIEFVEATDTGSMWTGTPEVKVVDYRGQEPAKNHGWGEWFSELLMSPTDRQKKRQERKQRRVVREEQFPSSKYVMRGAIEMLLNWALNRIFNNKKKTVEPTPKLIEAPVIDIEPITDYSNYQTGSWKEPETIKEPAKAGERTLGGKLKKKAV
nr:hypothetical protein [Nitrosomonas nitrosa]